MPKGSLELYFAPTSTLSMNRHYEAVWSAVFSALIDTCSSFSGDSKE